MRAPRCLSEIGQQGNCPNSKRKPPPLGGFRESERKFEISVAVGISGLPQFELCDSSATGRRQLSDTSAESKIQNPENPQCESAPGKVRPLVLQTPLKSLFHARGQPPRLAGRRLQTRFCNPFLRLKTACLPRCSWRASWLLVQNAHWVIERLHGEPRAVKWSDPGSVGAPCDRHRDGGPRWPK